MGMTMHKSDEKRSRSHTASRIPSWSVMRNLCIAILLANLAVVGAWAQRGTGTISGVIEDSKGAVLVGVKAVLENGKTGDLRETTSNGTGLFIFNAVPVGTYKVTIESPGFTRFVATDIVIHSAEDHMIPNILLTVAGSTSSVEVVASQADVIPVDTGTSSTTISESMVNNLPIMGRDAAELVRFMPGMGTNNGVSQVGFNSETTQTNSGPIGHFSANGTQPYGSMQMTLDGASLVDVGNQGTQIANVNQDTTAEFTYLNAAFGADTPRGPTIIQITSKGGGKGFHGDIYGYARNWQANANDHYNVQTDVGRGSAHQYYPGFTVGGPVVLPGSKLYSLRNKLFFFAGYENMRQTPSPTLHQLVTPTDEMIAGDFSAATLPGMQTSSTTWWPTSAIPCNSGVASWTGYCPGGVGGDGISSTGIINKSLFDSDGLALMKYLNKINTPNADPAKNKGYNFNYQDATPVNRWELRLRGDYAPTESDKFNVVYTKQIEGDNSAFGIWWWPGDTAPLPSKIVATTDSHLITANYTHVFKSLSTNEFSFAHSYFTYPPKFADNSAMSNDTAGFTNYTPFDTSAVSTFSQLPNLISWGCSLSTNAGCFPGLYAPPMIKSFQGGAYGNIKKITSFQDNYSRLMGRHSLKAGFYWDSSFQTQTTGYGNWTQGAAEFDNWAYYTTGNPLADMLMGHVDAMTQYSDAPTHSLVFHAWAVYLQDQWKVNNHLTLNYGVRFDHDGQWYPTSGTGLAVFDPSSYDDTAYADTWTGMKWHQIDHSIPQSGFISKFVNADPRGGAAYDIQGNGKYVVRVGAGLYRWQFSEGDVDSAMNPGLNVQNIVTSSTKSFKEIAGYTTTATNKNNCQASYSCSSVQVIKKGEDSTPYVANWDLMFDYAAPWHLSLEAQYIGNATRNALLTGNGSTSNFYANINKIPVGGLYGTSTLTGINYWTQSCAKGSCAAPSSSQYGGYVPYKNYSTLDVTQHGSYSNYHGLVLAAQKQQGWATFLFNYTFSKVLGVRDGQSNNGTGDGTAADGFSLANNYGVLSYDHTHIFNLNYYLQIPKVTHINRYAGEVINGWALSGDLNWLSGSPIQPNTGANMNAVWGGDANAAQLLGTNGNLLMPYLSCDIKKGGKYFNSNCFSTPTTRGVNGPTVWPYIKLPANFNTDIGLGKSFYMAHGQRIEFRAQAFDFVNYGVPEFGDTTDLKLNLSCTITSTGCTSATNSNTTTNGKPAYTRGSRKIEVALKYYF